MPIESRLGLPFRAYTAAAKAILYRSTTERLSFSDLLGVTGIVLLFPDLVSNQNAHSFITLLVCLGTHLDNLADEGPVAKSKGGETNNITNFMRLSETLSRHPMIEKNPNMLVCIKEYFQIIWQIEAWGHKLDASDTGAQKKYRELVNAAWSILFSIVTPASLTNYSSTTEIHLRGTTIPSLAELTELATNEIVIDQITTRLHEKLAGSREATLLYLFLMHAANWYDTSLNAHSNSLQTPRIRHQTDEYLLQLGLQGINPIVSRSMFSLAEILIRVIKKSRKVRKLLLNK